jgi:hypothetical protein
MSWHAALHNLGAVVGLPALVGACGVLAVRFRAEGRWAWAAYSVVTGLGLLAPDVLFGTDEFFLVLAVAVALAWTWTSGVAARLLIDEC